MQKIEFVPRRTFLAHLVSSSAFVIGARAGAFDFNGATTAEMVSDADKAAWNPNVYLGIEPDGKVILVMHRSEMGTGSRSVLPVVMAEELDADWKLVTLEQAIGDPKYGSQNTDGSCSIRDFYDTFREAGATARLMLERAAAQKWGVPPAECKAQNHFVVHAKSKKKLGFGELSALAKQQPVPKKEELTFKSSADYRYVGKELPTADRDSLVNGKGIFGIDATMPGMVYASIERSPVFGGKLKSFDDKDAKAVKGVMSPGMLCSEVELAIGDDDSGIIVLAQSDPTPLGAPAQIAVGVDDWMFEIKAPANRGMGVQSTRNRRTVCARQTL